MTPEEYFKKINAEDKDSIINLQTRKPMDFIPTGSWVLNQIIGDGTMTGKPGGYPRGHIVEILGDESSGKTTCGLSAIVQAQKLGGLGILMDFEQTFHPDYAEKLGVVLDKDKFIVTQPMSFQQGARQIKDMLSMRPPLIVVDSVSAMLPKEFLEGAIDEAGRMGLQAQLMSAFLSIISKYLQECNTCLLFINQLRSVIKKSKWQTGPDEEGSGGRALKFYSSVRLKLRKSTVEKIKVRSKITGKVDEEPTNVTIKASVIKNKIDKPYYSAPVYVRFGEGFDNILSIIELGINLGTIKKAGAFYTFTHNNKQLFKAQGKEQLRQVLNDNSEIFETLRSNLIIKEDAAIRKVYEKLDDNDPDPMEDLLDNVSSSFIEKHKEKKAKKNRAKKGESDETSEDDTTIVVPDNMKNIEETMDDSGETA